MHFCVSAARVPTASAPTAAPGHLSTSGFRWPRKMGTNWFMPALVNSKFGESGMSELDGTMVCCFDLKKSRNDWRISDDVIVEPLNRQTVESLNRKIPRKQAQKIGASGGQGEEVCSRSSRRQGAL